MTDKGIIFDIQRFSLGNGPGIRTTVFMKGCPLHCLWCHNPESQKLSPVVMFSGKDCVNCGLCVKICPEHCHVFEGTQHRYFSEHCIGCGRCAEVCPMKANTLKGKICSAEEILTLAARDMPFYRNTGGGLTVSGGEPLMQDIFVIKLLEKAKKNGIHTCLDTSGCIRIQDPEKLVRNTDLILFDIKELDQEKHTSYTGGDLRTVLANLTDLSDCGADIILRCPVIPGCNDEKEELENIGKLAERLPGVREIHIIPYHDFWKHKLKELGKNSNGFSPRVPAPETVEEWVETVKRYTVKRVTGI